MQGSLFIPDITGFTKFVKNVNIDLGVSITKELLKEIINSNPLRLELAEIEGDAILYYKIGKPISPVKIFEGCKKISEAFDWKYKILKRQYNLSTDLSLKFIVHYGHIEAFEIVGKMNLYGEAVIESHVLLKNGSGLSNYILITEDYFTALKQTYSHLNTTNIRLTPSSSNLVTGLRKIAYHFFSNSSDNAKDSSLLCA